MTNDAEELKRPTAAGIDKILGVRFNVLDDGFVRVVDYMGNDESIVQAARVSYGKGTKRIHQDRGLIRYLMRHRHTTPFEMCEIKFHVRVPMDCWRQWIRHRTANVNEYSTRYSKAIDAAQKTTPAEWREQAKSNRQGSGAFVEVETGHHLTKREAELHSLALDVYEERLKYGIAREQARKDLPLSTYTEAYWKIDLHNLFHFLTLRMASNAQVEIRSYASVIGNEIVSRWCPMAWEAFVNYRLDGMVLSRIDREIISHLAGGRKAEAREVAERHGWLEHAKDGLKRNRERDELAAKLEILGFEPPWYE
jgi:thymidylate synthase (FAD)